MYSCLRISIFSNANRDVIALELSRCEAVDDRHRRLKFVEVCEGRNFSGERSFYGDDCSLLFRMLGVRISLSQLLICWRSGSSNLLVLVNAELLNISESSVVSAVENLKVEQNSPIFGILLICLKTGSSRIDSFTMGINSKTDYYV